MVDKNEKKAITRIVAFSAAVLWCLFLSVSYAYRLSLVSAVKEGVITAEEVEITPLVNLMGYVYFDIGPLMKILVSVFLLVVLSFMPMIILKTVFIQDATIIEEDEYSKMRIVWLGGILLSVVVGFIVTKMTAIIPLIVYTGIWAAISFVFLNPVRKRSIRTVYQKSREKAHFFD